MKKSLLNLLLYSVIFLTIGCGFKAINKEQRGNFKIKEITSSGDQRINFKIKNDLNMFSNNNNENIIIIDLETTKNKTIKDKNIRNEITKYQIRITAIINVRAIKNDNNFKIEITETGNYSVSRNNMIATVSNERKLSKKLAEEIAIGVVDKIDEKLNDN
tara:strand:+ start:316 stop:795 length:480 start_codon:yes stop_codon:yes gene_type:complete